MGAVSGECAGGRKELGRGMLTVGLGIGPGRRAAAAIPTSTCKGGNISGLLW